MSIFRVITFLLLSIFGCFTEQCSVSDSEQAAVDTLMQVLQESAEDESADPDPATYLGLRSAHRHDQRLEEHFLERLKAAAIRKVTQGREHDLPTGSVALYVLAFRAGCLNPSSISNGQAQINLVKILGDKLNMEFQNLESQGHLLTDFYQISLAMMALCIEKQPVLTAYVEKIYDRVMGRKDQFGEPFLIDTASMTVLALSCIHNGNNLDIMEKHHIEQAIMLLLRQLLNYQQMDGTFGTIYNTGLAVQAFVEQAKLEFTLFHCSKNLQLLVSEIYKGSFNTVQKAFPVLLALEGKPLLHVGDPSCRSRRDNLPKGENER
ncbi:transcobalamin-2-like isoform X1 [Hypanus sabinus]|uniref:transcobalamin-2-like isoform X1 n=2 Tax=Hypanus sabinus TaxID=79690 RepID=UPI0028C4BEA8|nr:transcobalamin-2-like isoform X1 [Hypanus sabinus]